MRNQKISRFHTARLFYLYRLYQSCRFDPYDTAHLSQSFGTPTNQRKWTFSTWVKKSPDTPGREQTLFSANISGDTYGFIRTDGSHKLQVYAIDTGVTTCNVLTEGYYNDPSSWYHVLVVFNSTDLTQTERVRIYVNGLRSLANFSGSGPDFHSNLVLNTAQGHALAKDRTGITRNLNGYLSETIFVDGQPLTPSDFGEFKNGIWCPKQYAGTFGINGFHLDYRNSAHFGEDQSGNNNDFTDNGLDTVDQVKDNPTNNFCVLNTIDPLSTGVIFDGSLEFSTGDATVTMRPTSGKWYYEKDGVGVEYDCGVSGPFNPTLSAGSYNFGQQPFVGVPSAGFVAICTNNLPNPAILEGNMGFAPYAYIGTGAENAIDIFKFAPDFVWIKNRDVLDSHQLIDTARLVSNRLSSDNFNAEGYDGEGLKSFDANGYTLGGDTRYNGSGERLVSWNWKVDPLYGVDIVLYTGNGSGGRTIAHGLGAVPAMIIVKNREAVQDWQVYHHKMNAGVNPEDYTLELNQPTGKQNQLNRWNDTAPTDSVFTVGNSDTVNNSGDDYVAYLFAEVLGFSKAFSFTGNGDTDGPFIHFGFRPSFMLLKNEVITGGWHMYDSARDPHNIVSGTLFPEATAVESTDIRGDFVANGFKVRISGPDLNGNGNTIVGIAFAESPFKYANAR